VIEQVLARWKSALTTYLAGELAKVLAFDAPAGMVTFGDAAHATLRSPTADDIYVYPVPDEMVFSKRVAIVVTDIDTRVIERQKGAPYRLKTEHRVTVLVIVADPDPVELSQRLWRTMHAVRMTTERYAWSSSPGTNDGNSIVAHVDDLRSTGARQTEAGGGWAKSGTLIVRFLEQEQVEYTNI
jgi:hypothetical protein